MEVRNGLAERVAANVRAEMAANGISIKELGLMLGIGERAASKRFHGQVPYSLDDLDVLSERFGYDLQDFARQRPVVVREKVGA